MKHPDLKVTDITIREQSTYRVRIESWECVAPAGLIAINFIQECLNDKGAVDSFSTYSYNMTREELNNLAEGLLKL
jgi:hypothetical protein